MNSTTAPTNTSSEDNGSGYHFTIIALLIVLIFITLSIATVAGNGIFLLTFYKDPLKCLRTPSAILMAGLTSANFLIGLIVEPAFVIIYVFAFVYVDVADFDKFYRFAEVFTFMNNEQLVSNYASSGGRTVFADPAPKSLPKTGHPEIISNWTYFFLRVFRLLFLVA